jgi:uncharacterized protein YgiM (DUF1202 family)
MGNPMMAKNFVALLLFLALAPSVYGSEIGRITDDVKFREGPSRSWPIIEILATGTEVQIFKRLPNGWYLIAHRDKRGFVHGDYLEAERAANLSKVLGQIGRAALRKEVGIVAAIIFTVIFLWPLRRCEGFKIFRLTLTLLVACAILIILTDVAFRLGFLYSFIFVSLALVIVSLRLLSQKRTAENAPLNKLPEFTRVETYR